VLIALAARNPAVTPTALPVIEQNLRYAEVFSVAFSPLTCSRRG
jgi:hypothetical protein